LTNKRFSVRKLHEVLRLHFDDGTNRFHGQAGNVKPADVGTLSSFFGRKRLVHETVRGKALDRAMEIVQRLSLHTPESVAYIKRLVRSATETPLAIMYHRTCTRAHAFP
jgi:hypothetical protein